MTKAHTIDHKSRRVRPALRGDVLHGHGDRRLTFHDPGNPGVRPARVFLVDLKMIGNEWVISEVSQLVRTQTIERSVTPARMPFGPMRSLIVDATQKYLWRQSVRAAA